MTNKEKIHWASELGKRAFELMKDAPDKKKEEVWERIILSLPEGDRGYGMVGFLSAWAEWTTTFEEFEKPVNLAIKYNLLRMVNLKPEEAKEKKPFRWRGKYYLPSDLTDKRMEALVRNFIQASRRIKGIESRST